MGILSFINIKEEKFTVVYPKFNEDTPSLILLYKDLIKITFHIKM